MAHGHPTFAASFMFVCLLLTRHHATTWNCFLTRWKRIGLRLLSNLLDDSNAGVKRIRGGRHVRTDQFSGTTRRFRRELRHRFSEHPHWFAGSQFPGFIALVYGLAGTLIVALRKAES